MGRRTLFLKKKARQKNREVTCLKPKSSPFWGRWFIYKKATKPRFSPAWRLHIRDLYSKSQKNIYKFWAVYIQISGGLYTNFGRFIYKFGAVTHFFRGPSHLFFVASQGIAWPWPHVDCRVCQGLSPALASSGFCFSSRF